MIRVKKISLGDIVRELVRDRLLKCFGKKGYQSVVFDISGVKCWFLEWGSSSGYYEVRRRNGRRSPLRGGRREAGLVASGKGGGGRTSVVAGFHLERGGRCHGVG